MTRDTFWQKAFLAAFRLPGVNVDEAETCADEALASYDERFPNNKVADELAGYRDPAVKKA